MVIYLRFLGWLTCCCCCHDLFDSELHPLVKDDGSIIVIIAPYVGKYTKTHAEYDK